MEQVVLVDKTGREIGAEEKLRAHLEGKLHRAFSVFVFDPECRLLLQRRAKDKYHSGGLWSNTCCGHPRPNEPLKNGAERRLHEEFGFTCDLSESFHFLYKTQFANGLIENEFDHVMVGRYHGLPQPNPAEIEDLKWMSLDDLNRATQSVPEDFTFWLRTVLRHRCWSGVISKL